MRRFPLVAALAALFLCTFFFCADDIGNSTGGGDPGVVGTWVEELAALPPYLPKGLTITMTFESDLTFEVSLVEAPAKTLFTDIGTWETVGDSIYLTGTECQAVTTADPDTLMALPDSVCSTTVSVEKPTGSPWSVRISDLGPIIRAFPIPESFLPFVENIRLDFEKQE